MNKLITTENIAIAMAAARESCNKSQKYMAKALGKSIGTVQNWEYGYSLPNVIDLMEWFEILGINPLRYALNFLHPDTYEGISPEDSTEYIREAVLKWFEEIASDADVRKIAYCIFGNTGSSWSGQLDEWCALNHLPLMDRINVADSICNLYTLRKMRGELRGEGHIMPDDENLKECIYKCKVAVINDKTDYSN